MSRMRGYAVVGRPANEDQVSDGEHPLSANLKGCFGANLAKAHQAIAGQEGTFDNAA
jgi:hypothetical protein